MVWLVTALDGLLAWENTLTVDAVYERISRRRSIIDLFYLCCQKIVGLQKKEGREGEEKKADDSHHPEAKQTGYNPT